MANFSGARVRHLLEELIERSRHVGTNVTLYTGPELGRLAEMVGQRTIYGGHNWDTRVRSRSAKYTVVVGSEKVAMRKLLPEQQETLEQMDWYLTRVFGGTYQEHNYVGHVNQLPIDLVHRVMGSGEDSDFTFNCYLLVTAKNRANHHISYMWGRMLRAIDPVPEVDDLYILLVPDIPTGDFGRFYAFPEEKVTVGIGSDYMGEPKKGFLRLAMYRAKQRGILGLHAGAKIVIAHSAREGQLRRWGVIILGMSGTGKTTNIGHTHFLDDPEERSLVVQDDFVGLRLEDGRILGTEQAMFLKTDLDEDDLLLRPATQSSDFLSQNLYINYQGEMCYEEEDLCRNGRGILPLSALPPDRRYEFIDLPPLEELDGVFFIFITRCNTVVPILQELTSPEQAAAYFMLGESVETAAGDPTRAGQPIRVPGTNPFIVGPEGEEGNLFYEYLNRYRDKVRCFVLNTGGVGGSAVKNEQGEWVAPEPACRPWKEGVGYITRALFRETTEWAVHPDFGTRVLVGGVLDSRGQVYDLDRFDPRRYYDTNTYDEIVGSLNQRRLEHLEQFAELEPNIVETFLQTHRR